MKFKIRLKTLFFIWVVFAQPGVTQEKKNKVVYLDLEDESLSDMPFFAGLVIEDKSTQPSVHFQQTVPPAPQEEFQLSPSLRDYILIHEREIVNETGSREK